MKQLTQKQIETFKNLAKKKTSKEISPDDWSVYKISEGNFDDAYWIGCNDSEIETARFILNLLNIEYKQETFGSKVSNEVELPQRETLYTEEQVFGFLDFYNSIDFNKSEYRYQPPSMDRSEKDYNKSIDRKILKEYIKSLKQPKKD